MMFPLLQMRVRFFRVQTRSLYERYLDAGFLFALLFAPALSQAPALVLRPVLIFLEAPSAWREPAPVLIWLALAAVWARIHRGFIQGGQLAGFVRSLPIPGMRLRLVDLAMLAMGMSVFFLPLAFGAWEALRSDQAAGAGGRFWLCLALLALLTLSLARDLVYGAHARSRYVHLLAVAALLSPPVLHPVLGKAWVLCALSACLAANLVLARVDTARGARARLAWLEKLAWCPPLVLLFTTVRRFLRTQWHDSMARILWACLPLAFCWWMLEVVGKREDAQLFTHAALGGFTGILAGCYRSLLDGRAALSAYARSMAHGERILALCDHVLVVSIAAAILLPWLGLFEGGPTGASTLALFCFYGALLVLLGSRRIQLHKRSAILIACLAAAGMFTGGSLL